MKTLLINALATILLLIMPFLNFAQAPPLGTAADFVLFTSVGAVTNTGISQLTGNVGSNSGSSTGFGNVNGNMLNNNGATGQAAADVLIAYNLLNSAIPTFFPAPLLGNGQILTPGIYSISAPATLNLNLTLDAQGNSDAVFIIQIQGAFSTGPGAKVKLVNGALACNVFWKVEGLVSMASGTSMKGTIIANNAAIMISAGDTLEGRALSTAGAISVNGVMAYTPIGCGSPYLTGPAAPALASTACYALFSGDGPVSNSGITHVTGDVGTNVGLTTGFNPLFVAGMIHPVPDGSTAQAAADLTNVYTYLNTLPYDIELLYPAQFGQNLVLTPHTYLLNAATVLTDTLFLNGEGNADAVFVMQINGALSTSTYSKVILKNGTQAKNVFWKVNGAVSINDYSVFKGTIIGANGAIILKTGVALDGRALTTVGSLSTFAITATMPPGCGTASAPVIGAQPVDTAVCAGSSASFSVTATGAGLTYQWRKGTVNLVNGGNISGATSATLTINPVTISDTASNYNVVVTDLNGLSTTSANVSLAVTPLPVPTITGPASVCIGSTGNIYTTQTAMTGYTWTVSAGGTITAGDSTNAVTVTWNTAGANTVSVNYANGNSCTAATDTVYNVTVNSLPVPLISGDTYACVNSSGNVYSTEAGMTAYNWTVSAGGIITAGAGTNTITVSWNTTGINTVYVNYNNNGCQAQTPSSLSVNVNTGTSPTITGPVELCAGSTGIIYTTEAGFLNYVWTISYGGYITSGLNTNQVTVNWSTAGQRTISVNYVNESGCGADSSYVYNVTVLSVPVPVIFGTDSVCNGATDVIYSTQPGNSDYVWTVSSGGTIVAGAGTSAVKITWNTDGNQTVSVNYTNSLGCEGQAPSVFTVYVKPLPAAAGTIIGTSTVCAGSQGVTYTVPVIANATSYAWTVPAGATIVSGGTTNSITVDFSPAAVQGVIKVNGTNECGTGTASPAFNLTVDPLPATPVITQYGDTLTSSAPAGNQWYLDGVAIPGATGMQHLAVYTGYYTVVVTLDLCSSAVSNSILVLPVSISDFQDSHSFEVYPNPNYGVFNLKVVSNLPVKLNIEIYNSLGNQLWQRENVIMDGTYITPVDLSVLPKGIYTVTLHNKDINIVRKVVIMK